MRTLIASIIIIVCGCSSSHERSSAGTQLPPVEGRGSGDEGTTSPTGRRLAGRDGTARQGAPPAGGEQEHRHAAHSPFSQEFEAAARELARKVQEKDAQGWPMGVPRSSEVPSRPVARIGDLSNLTRQHVDMTTLEDAVMHALVETGCMKVLAKGVESTDGPFMEVRGSVEDQVTEAGGTKQTDIWVKLQLVNLDGGIVLSTRTQFRRMEEGRD